MTIQAPRGTKDIFGSEVLAWQWLEEQIRNLCRDFSVSEIRTPMFEHTEVFVKGTGENTDVVQKEMYTFIDKGGRSITLRPEITASAARAFIENKMYANVQPTKLYYISPVFRYEKPQAGRMRQFHQFGVEYFGAYGSAADAEVISLAYELIRRLGIKNTTLQINSLGGAECRSKYNDAVKSFLNDNIDKLCDTCRERLEKNPLRALDCKVKECKRLMEGAPSVLDCLGQECKTHFELLQKLLSAMDIPFTVNPKIVRGLDYYTRTVFEFICTDLGAQSAVCGGGRYDNLIEGYGGSNTGAVGFAFGMERLLLTLENQNNLPLNQNKTQIFIGSIGQSGFITASRLVYELRRQGITAEGDTLSRSVKAQLKYADKTNATYSIILGDNEVSTGQGKIKNMQTGDERETSLDAESIRNIINNG